MRVIAAVWKCKQALNSGAENIRARSYRSEMGVMNGGVDRIERETMTKTRPDLEMTRKKEEEEEEQSY